MIIDSQPLTVAVVAALVFGESITPLGVFGLFLGLAGLLLLELPEDQLAALSTLDFGAVPMVHIVFCGLPCTLILKYTSLHTCFWSDVGHTKGHWLRPVALYVLNDAPTVSFLVDNMCIEGSSAKLCTSSEPILTLPPRSVFWMQLWVHPNTLSMYARASEQCICPTICTVQGV